MIAGALFIGLTTIAFIAYGLRLRRRLARVSTLPTAPADEVGKSYELVVADGVDVADEVYLAAAGYARQRDLGVLDLIPADLPTEQAMDLARSVDPREYRTDPIAQGRGAGYAILIGSDVRERWAAEKIAGLDPSEMAEATVRLRQYAGPMAADLVVAPMTVSRDVVHRRTMLRVLGITLSHTIAIPQTLGLSIAGYLLALSCLLVDPFWGLVPVIAYCAQPYLALAALRSPEGCRQVRPRDLHRAVWLRPVRTPLSWWRTLRAPRSSWERRLAERIEEARPWYQSRLAGGVEGFLAERRDTCPWCGATDLKVFVRTRETVQGKPGRFTLERCRGCGHVFENPQLTADGLDFYYRDFYDGLNDTDCEHIFAGQQGTLRDRAALVAAFTTPRSWLDVGTGHAHFCRIAKTVFPDTEFHGLDFGDAVAEALRRGWISHAYDGLFPEKAAELAGRYDVISMHHYLEHTLDPFAELDAVATALGSGGHLLIEIPDPESWFGRVLRTLWIPWFPPQHLHLPTIGNLKAALAERGLPVIAEVRRDARQGFDVPHAAMTALNLLWMDPRRPWATKPPTVFSPLRRALAVVLAPPVIVVTFGIDFALRPFMRGRSNAYRILARKL